MSAELRAPVVLLDTGPIVALFNPRDADHGSCRRIFASRRPKLVTTAPVLTEAFHILSPESRASHQLRRFVLSGATVVRPLDGSSLRRAFELMDIYSNLPMDLADASLVVTAEALSTRRIFTLDRRDFSVYRLRSGRRQVAFEIFE